MNENIAMLWARKVRSGEKTMNDVPKKLKKLVKALLEG